jgi:hypothetical protein
LVHHAYLHPKIELNVRVRTKLGALKPQGKIVFEGGSWVWMSPGVSYDFERNRTAAASAFCFRVTRATRPNATIKSRLYLTKFKTKNIVLVCLSTPMFRAESSNSSHSLKHSAFSVENTQSGPEVRPRRKALDGSRPESVIITLEIITRLMDFPVSEAASRLGISATAFKKACRKLGLQRWTYTKHGSRKFTGPNASQMVKPTSACTQRIPQKCSSNSNIPKGSTTVYKARDSPECKAGKTKIEQAAELNSIKGNLEQVNDVPSGKLTSSPWYGPREEAVGPLNFIDAEQIFAEELLLDDECALAILDSIWKPSSLQYPPW